MSIYTEKARYFVQDTRINMHELDAEENLSDLSNIKKNALAVACLMEDTELKEDKKKQTYDLSNKVMNLSDIVSRTPIRKGEPEIFDAPLAKYEKFRKEPAPGFGTGFLVLTGKKKNKILTAGHCVCVRDRTSKLKSTAELAKIRVVFRYHKTDPNTDKKTFANDDVYKVKRVIAHSYNYNNKAIPDWALVKLDREVVGIKPIEVDFSAKEGNSVYVIGCPTGLAVKCAGIGHAVIRSFESNFIYCDLDTFSGNSGSPIIDRVSNRAIGILIGGQTDYAIDTEYKEQTGIRRVITYKVKANEGYELGQRIHPHLLDFHKFVAKRGRKIRKELSNGHSEKFVKALEREKNDWEGDKRDATLLMFTGIGLLGGLILRQVTNHQITIIKEDLNSYRRLKRRLSNKPNLLESKHFMGLNEELLTNTAIQIARNMAAYGIGQYDATNLQSFEVNVFKHRFSPDKVLDLLRYEHTKNLNFTVRAEKRILKYMQKMDPQNTTAFLDREKKMKAVAEARIKACCHITKNESTYKNYDKERIKKIARYMVQEAPRINFEQAQKELEYCETVLLKNQIFILDQLAKEELQKCSDEEVKKLEVLIEIQSQILRSYF